MKILNLGISEGDVKKIKCRCESELILHILELENEGSIWLGTDDCVEGEIYITENIHTIVDAIEDENLMHFTDELHLHKYDSYEDAYSVALTMREPNPKCYN